MRKCLIVLLLLTGCSHFDIDYYKDKPEYGDIEDNKTKYKVKLRWKHIYIENGLKTRKYGINMRDNKIYFRWIIPFDYLK